MRAKDLYAQILGIQSPWQIVDVKLLSGVGEVKVYVETLIEIISMDMWPAFINATLESFPDAENKIAFDKFHVDKYLGEAANKVCRQ